VSKVLTQLDLWGWWQPGVESLALLKSRLTVGLVKKNIAHVHLCLTCNNLVLSRV